MNTEDDEFNRIERESNARMMAVRYAIEKNWPFPPPSGPKPWTKAQEREHQQQINQQLPEAPL